ncbi:MAG: hypothetical protein ACI810_002988 [Gammaproteobacteria bacterium]
MRYQIALESMNICNVTAHNENWGLFNPRLLMPGTAAQSLIYERANRHGLGQMPPLVSQEIDVAGTALLASWINSLSACP